MVKSRETEHGLWTQLSLDLNLSSHLSWLCDLLSHLTVVSLFSYLCYYIHRVVVLHEIMWAGQGTQQESS